MLLASCAGAAETGPPLVPTGKALTCGNCCVMFLMVEGWGEAMS